VADLDLKSEAIAESDLQPMLPKPGSIAIASAAIGQDEKSIGLRVAVQTDLSPPPANGVDGELGSIGAGTDTDEALIAGKVVDAVGDGDAFGIGGEVMIEDPDRTSTPFLSGLVEGPDQLATLGVNADYG
jgi:hypothetical protein